MKEKHDDMRKHLMAIGEKRGNSKFVEDSWHFNCKGMIIQIRGGNKRTNIDSLYYCITFFKNISFFLFNLFF